MEMITLCGRPEHCDDPHRNAVVDGLNVLRAQEVRVYRTYIVPPEGSNGLSFFMFVTASKDVHLFLGCLEQPTQWHLGCLLEKAFEESGYPNQMIVKKDKELSDGWLVTRNSSGTACNCTTFTFSPVR